MPAKPKKNGRQNYDWDLIKMDYVSDPRSSLKNISEKYGIRLRTVADKSKADDWFATKKKFQAEVVEKATAKLTAKATTKKADELANAIKAASNIAEAILKKTEDPDQFCRYIVQEGSAESYGSNEYVFDKMDMRAAKDAMSALKCVEDMLRGYHGILKAETLNKQEIERERLELEKERLALERERNALRSGNISSENDTQYGVVLIPEVMPNE